MVRRAAWTLCNDVAVGVDQNIELRDQDLDKLIQALTLFERLDPRRYRRMKHDVDRILVAHFSTASGVYFPGSRSIHLSSELLRDFPPSNIALSLVHEATHARIDHAGILSAPVDLQRIERRCALEEIAFARRLPVDTYPNVGSWIVEKEHTVETIRSKG
jgi:hypothetical protein